MGIWRSIFGWKALFRWDALGAVVPGFFVAAGLGMLSVDWFPHHLLIAQVCFAVAGFLCVVKIIGHSVESRDTVTSRVVFATILGIIALGITVWLISVIQHHKNFPTIPPPPPPPLVAPAPLPPTINQSATDSDCANQVAQSGSKINCEAPEKQRHAKKTHP